LFDNNIKWKHLRRRRRKKKKQMMRRNDDDGNIRQSFTVM
jgi:hypothetical protein